jgi:hypothetical protein
MTTPADVLLYVGDSVKTVSVAASSSDTTDNCGTVTLAVSGLAANMGYNPLLISTVGSCKSDHTFLNYG